MIDAFGWTWEYIDDEVTLPMYKAIAKRWESVPPLSLSMAVMAGTYKKPAGKRGESGIQSLFEDLAASGGAVGKTPEWLKNTK